MFSIARRTCPGSRCSWCTPEKEIGDDSEGGDDGGNDGDKGEEEDDGASTLKAGSYGEPAEDGFGKSAVPGEGTREEPGAEGWTVQSVPTSYKHRFLSHLRSCVPNNIADAPGMLAPFS